MYNETVWDREEEEIERQYTDGEITLKEYNQAMRELRIDYQAAMQEAAQNAYDEELNRW